MFLGDTYIDPNQPWLGTQSSTASKPWWQGVVDVAKKITSAVKSAQPAVTQIQQQINALKNQQSSGSSSYTGTYGQGGYMPQPPGPPSSNTGVIVLGVAGVIAAGAIIYAVASGNQKSNPSKSSTK